MAYDLIDRYLTLERIMMEADERGDEPFADSLRDLMDSIWYRLIDEEHVVLNRREALSIAILYPVTVSISDDTFSEALRPLRTTKNAVSRGSPTAGGWRPHELGTHGPQPI